MRVGRPYRGKDVQWRVPVMHGAGPALASVMLRGSMNHVQFHRSTYQGVFETGCCPNVNDVTQAHALVHGEETDVFADSGYQGVGKRDETQGIEVNWHVAMRPGKRKVLDKSTPMGAILDQLEQAKVRIRAKVEHPFRVIKRQFGRVKVRYRGLAKNTAQLHTLFALSNLWMVRRTLLQEM